MSLPENGAPWPPPAWSPYYEEMRRDDAWYAGDPARLARIYGADPRPTERRKMWARRPQPTAPGRPPTRLHVPFPGDIARTSADLLFADMPAITATDTTTQDRLTALVEEDRLGQTLLGAGEQAAALGGVFLRVTWDRELADRPLLTVMQPDGAIPEWRFGMLRAVTFWRELEGATTHTVMRHFERHERGTIRHALYEGTADNVGRAVPLTAHPDTATIADSLDATGDGQTIATGIDQLTAAYVPNMLPNRLHRGSPVGRSDYSAPLYDLFDALDETWTSWMRDLRLARARLIVPSGYLNAEGPGRGATFDADREIYEQLNIPPNEGAGITLSQFAIRVEEHQRTADALVRQCAMSAGYSAQSFGLDGDGAAITATEVTARTHLSMVTRRKKASMAEDPLADILHAWLALDARLFGSRITPQRPTIEFGSGVAEDPQRTASTLDMLHRAAAISTETKVRTLHPDWDEQQVKAETARILAETGEPAPDPAGSFPM